MIQLNHFLQWSSLACGINGFTGSWLKTQYIVSFLHTLMIAYSGFASPEYYLTYLSASVNYFIIDSLFILGDIQHQWYYWFHHGIAIFVGMCGDAGYISPILIPYMHIIELSNVFLSAWDYTKRNRELIGWHQMLTPMFAWTYIPLRSLVLPYFTYQMIAEAVRMAPWTIALPLVVAYVAIQAMSWWFSKKLYGIARYKLSGRSGNAIQSRVAQLFAQPDDRWWPVVSYIGKLYLDLWLVLAVLPHHPSSHWMKLVLWMDLVHIGISWTFNVYNFEPWIERWDALSIHTKIVVNGFYAFGMGGRPHHALNMFNIGLLGRAIDFLWSPRTQHIPISESKLTYSMSYGIHFLISSYAVMLYTPAPYGAISVASYAVGALLWIARIPERWWPHTVWSSLGWLHVCVIVGDMAPLLSNAGYI